MVGGFKVREISYKVDIGRMGHGGGLVVSALAYCSEDPSSNPVDY